MFAINPYPLLIPTPAPVGGPLGWIDFGFAGNRTVVKKRFQKFGVRFWMFRVPATGPARQARPGELWRNISECKSYKLAGAGGDELTHRGLTRLFGLI